MRLCLDLSFHSEAAGGIDGLTLSGNQMYTPTGVQRAGSPDIVLYSNTHTNAAAAADNNCYAGSVGVLCNISTDPLTADAPVFLTVVV
jgi:hypothetical protein